MGRVVLVTGVCREVGARFARRLAEHDEVDKVVGVDVIPPRRDLGDVRFVRADIRNPVIGKVMDAEGVDTVVHLSVIATPAGAGGRASMKEINVIGTMQLLAACQKSPGVQRLVVKSSTGVYGSTPRDPAMFTEEMPARRIPRQGFGKDSSEVEAYVRGFARRRSDVEVSILRCANVLSSRLDTTLTRYFSLPVVPTVLGYDARLQFLHERDLMDVLELATLSERPRHGTFNVAGDGVVMLSQALRRLGRPTVALPAAALSGLAGLIPALRSADLSAEQIAFLTYGRGVDTTKMRRELEFEPTYTTPEAFAELADWSQPGVFDPTRIAGIEHQITTLAEAVGARGRR